MSRTLALYRSRRLAFVWAYACACVNTGRREQGNFSQNVWVLGRKWTFFVNLYFFVNDYSQRLDICLYIIYNATIGSIFFRDSVISGEDMLKDCALQSAIFFYSFVT